VQISESILKAGPPVTGPRHVRRSFSVSAGGPRPYLAWYVAVLSVCLFLYAVLGKGFAYAGYEPVYIGEVLLFCGLAVAAGARGWAWLARTPIGLLLGAFSLWGLARTLPFLSTFGVDALRDAALWGYSLFAWVVVAAIFDADDCLDTLVRRYGRYGGALLCLMLLSFLATSYLKTSLPVWPGTAVTIPLVKPGDMCVHVAGALAFILVGLGRRNGWWFVPAFGAFFLGSTGSRGGLLACAIAAGAVLVLLPKPRRIEVALAGLVLSLTIVSATDSLRLRLPNRSRSISTEQFVDNLESTVGLGSGAGDLDATRQWRIRWWTTIVGYTLNGPYFWTGKGYGVNLTVSDGVARPLDDTQLRSPHNSHITFLARSGVPGALLWLALQATWAFSMLRACRLAKRKGRSEWAKFFAWVLAYWLAFMVNAAFDVSLEGPVCGIPFWTIFGLGWGGCLKFGGPGHPRLSRPRWAPNQWRHWPRRPERRQRLVAC